MTLEHSAFALAAALGIRIADARRHLEAGLSVDDVEVCAKVAAKGAATLDDVVDMLAHVRCSNDLRPMFTFCDPGGPIECSAALPVGTLRRSFRSTCDAALRFAS